MIVSCGRNSSPGKREPVTATTVEGHGGLSGIRPEDHARLVASVQETFTEALEFTSDFTAHVWPNAPKHFDPVLIEEALVATGTVSLQVLRRSSASRALRHAVTAARGLGVAQ